MLFSWNNQSTNCVLAIIALSTFFSLYYVLYLYMLNVSHVRLHSFPQFLVCENSLWAGLRIWIRMYTAFIWVAGSVFGCSNCNVLKKKKKLILDNLLNILFDLFWLKNTNKKKMVQSIDGFACFACRMLYSEPLNPDPKCFFIRIRIGINLLQIFVVFASGSEPGPDQWKK